MVSMKHFNKLLEVNAEEKTVKVEGGMLLTELNDILEMNGLAMSVLGSVSDVSVAGAISTGTHGTGLKFGSLHTYVLELSLLCADGNVLTLDSHDSGTSDQQDMFRAACVSLGSLGIILSVKLQCEPAFRLHQVQYPVKLQDVIENLDVHLNASDHFRFMWYPHTDGCIAYHARRTTKPISRVSSWFWDYFIGYMVLEFLYWVSTFIASLVPWIGRVYYRLGSHRNEFVDRSDHVFNFNCLFRQHVMEWSFPREHTGVVLTELKSWIDNNFYAHFPVEVRFTAKDDALLSPCHGTDVCYINIVMYRPYMKDVDIERYWRAFQEIVMKVGGRPHWAKDFRMTPQQMRSLYPRWDRFVEIRGRLDPDRMFMNSSLKRIFGD
jgi:L-gulonolactone oxidase